jgi:tRNA (cmo5U34)-methyltransferase
VSQFHFDPATYLGLIRSEVAEYDELQERVAAATSDVTASRILDLGAGTGDTARRIVERHPDAALVALDASEAMLQRARDAVRAAELLVRRLEDELPGGPFDLVVSVLAVHHLHSAGKRDLFRRVFAALRAGGRFVLGDVVVPERPEDADVPLAPEYDVPDRALDQVAWLREIGFDARIVWERGDLVVVAAHRP